MAATPDVRRKSRQTGETCSVPLNRFDFVDVAFDTVLVQCLMVLVVPYSSVIIGEYGYSQQAHNKYLK